MHARCPNCGQDTQMVIRFATERHSTGEEHAQQSETIRKRYFVCTQCHEPCEQADLDACHSHEEAQK